MLNKLSNLIYVPLAIIGFILFGSVAELSYGIHNKTGLPFWLSMLLGMAVLFILILAAVSAFKFVRNFTVTAVRTYAHNRQQSEADTDDDQDNIEANQ